MRVLVCGAGICGPVVAYWLVRYGFTVVVVERSPGIRTTTGHAVDLFRPATVISRKMGVLHQIEERAIRTDRLTIHREGVRRPVRADLTTVFEATSDQHHEIMRGDLSQIYHGVTRDDVEYIFGDTVTAIGEDGTVAFERSAARKFDLVIGADGVHSVVRSLTFDAQLLKRDFIGAYVAAIEGPLPADLDHELILHVGVGRTAGMYGARDLGTARGLFLFRREDELRCAHDDIGRQRTLVRQAFEGMHPDVDDWLDHLDRAQGFYCEPITQLTMRSWSRGRAVLVGDAAYCPGAAVGGSTTLAVVGAYVLAGELARAPGHHEEAFAAYRRAMIDHATAGRAVARSAAKTLVPRSPLGVWGLAQGARLLSSLPVGPSRLLARLATRSARLYDSIVVEGYP